MKLPTKDQSTIITLNLSQEAPPPPTSPDPNVRYLWADNTYRDTVILPYIRRAMRAAGGDVDANGRPSSAEKLSWIRRWVNAWRTT